MKRIVFFIIIGLASITALAQNTTGVPTQNISGDSNIAYRLFSTRNMYTFIKLDTRNGQMWQVQWDTGKNQFETPLSLKKFASSQEEKTGRFFLYPTQNIYNFILLDQLDGRVWQVQWSTEVKERIVVPIQ
ncbi:hypothetical protein [Flavobacterium salmonis]|uniref:Uncharacterized protein n=1 Tax=Flavobacterium salmonis TaxID=2654844 RepID=A0A6V6YUE5_9FLAO|nr:hypothetical protein [Flavobacterium salmonis]CAD0002312.1 hypothetical protein FLAT13_01048 [Flavobacterium salmonis]